MLIDAYIKPAASSFGPTTVTTTSVSARVNPYDAEINDIRFITTVRGKTLSFPAYFDQGTWKANIVTPFVGTFTGRFTKNGKQTGEPVTFKVTTPLNGYVQKDGVRFSTTTGAKPKPYWPLGHNLAWQGGQYKFLEQMDLMKANGLNWTRIWACHWDNRNPYWPTSFPKPRDGEFSPEVLQRLDETVKGAEKNNLKFQFVLFHHGQVSTDVNPNWADHPWNKKNGGFLENASDFFTNAEAKRRQKNFIRYAIARWGYSTSIMAWELFNEVQFVEKIRKGNDWQTVGKWHDEMGTYIRSIDPYRHLITTSSEVGQPIWSKMDYLQAHAYPSSVHALVMGTKSNDKEPLFYGEIGNGDAGSSERLAVRDGLWGAFFAGHSGAAQYWYWDRMNQTGMYGEYMTGKAILDLAGNPMDFKRENLTADSPKGATFDFIPGRGWDKTDQTRFNLPADIDAAGKLSGYMQGPAKRDMQKEPLFLTFETPKAEKVAIEIAEVSAQGATALIFLDDKEVHKSIFAAGVRAQKTISIPCTPGKHTLRIESNGTDWYRIRSIQIPGIMPISTAYVSHSKDTSVIRVKSAVKEGKIAACSIRSEKWKNGDFTFHTFDLATGKRTQKAGKLENGLLELGGLSDDVIIVMKKRQR